MSREAELERRLERVERQVEALEEDARQRDRRARRQALLSRLAFGLVLVAYVVYLRYVTGIV